jgi:hypothetical protein
MDPMVGYIVFDVRFRFITVSNCVHVESICWRLIERKWKVMARASKNLLAHRCNIIGGQAFTK